MPTTPWTDAEDEKLKTEIEKYSCEDCPNQYRPDCDCRVFTKTKTWQAIGKVLGRTAGSVQSRWCGKLDPKVDLSAWTPEEDEQLLKIYSTHGTWVLRARELGKGDGVRRNGGDVCARYMKLKKSTTS